jgi:hypothetical protein
MLIIPGFLDEKFLNQGLFPDKRCKAYHVRIIY